MTSRTIGLMSQKKYGLGKSNQRGQELLQFCAINGLSVANTLFSKKEKSSMDLTRQDPQSNRLYHHSGKMEAKAKAR